MTVFGIIHKTNSLTLKQAAQRARAVYRVRCSCIMKVGLPMQVAPARQSASYRVGFAIASDIFAPMSILM